MKWYSVCLESLPHQNIQKVLEIANEKIKNPPNSNYDKIPFRNHFTHQWIQLEYLKHHQGKR